jgi:hypothetical protein
MQYVLGNMLNGGGGLNADGLALDLQFAADKTMTARKGPNPAFTRGSTGTFVGSNGLIQTAAVNAARFDHDPVTLACKGLLIEESRTNAAFQSGVIVNNIGWVVSSSTTGATSVASGTGPDSNTSYLISESATTAPHGLYNTGTNTVTLGASVTSGVAYTASAFVKKVTGNIDWIQILLGTGGFGSQYANFNLTTGQFGNVSGLTTRVEEHANGWYRISVTRNATVTTSTTATFGVNFINNTNGTTSGPSYAGSTSNQFLLTMCQFEAGSFPTSYIPTTTGSVVRSADVCSITGANFTSFYNSTSGTLLSEASIANLIGNNRGIVQVDNGTNESILRHLYSFGDGGFRSLIRAGGDTPTVLSTILGTASTIQKRIIAYEGTSFASVTNGGAVATATRTMPTGLNAMRIGNLTDGSFYLSGHVAAIRFYKKRLPNAKLVTLTT